MKQITIILTILITAVFLTGCATLEEKGILVVIERNADGSMKRAAIDPSKLPRLFAKENSEQSTTTDDSSGLPAPPSEAAILDMIFKEYPHRLDKGPSSFYLPKRPGMARAIWKPNPSMRHQYMEEGNFVTEIISVKIVKTDTGADLFVATASNTDTKIGIGGCRICKPMIGVASFVFDGKAWQLASNELDMGVMGAFGRPPSDVDFVKIGPGKWGFTAVDSVGGSGMQAAVYHLYLITESSPKLVFKNAIYSYWSPGIPGRGKYSNIDETEIKFVACESCEYYDLQITAKITHFRERQEGESVQIEKSRRETFRYTFKNGEYRNVGKKMPAGI